MFQKTNRPLPLFYSLPLSLIAWVLVTFFTVFCFTCEWFLLVLPSLLWDRKKRRWLSWVARVWGRAILLTSPFWCLEVQGREKIQRGKTYVIIANHQSLLDILVVLATLDMNFKFIAKKELFPIPFLGWHMALAGFIPLLRGNRESAHAALERAREYLRIGVSVLFFPEGTRSVDGTIQEFKMGAFKLAQEEDVAILPLVIDGTGDAAPKHSWFVRKMTRFRVLIADPILISREENLASARDRIRQAMVEQLEQMRKGRTKDQEKEQPKEKV